MVGLPARGKSYICKKLCRYLSWCGFNTKVFNVGNRRRTTHDANFFDPKNENAKAIRERLAMDTLDEAIDWLKYGGGKVAIHDATNSTVERRRAIIDRVAKEKNMQAVFVESICTDEKLLESNILMKLKGPDYINMPREEAIRDFKARMHNYEKAYETISEEEEALEDVSYIKLINVGKKVIANNIHGYIASQCVFYLMQIHIKKRVIWLTRHGESMYNAYNRIGGDPPLTELGHRYASALARFIQNDNQQQTHRGGTGIPTSNRHIATESDSDVSPDHPNPDTVATNGPNTIPPRPLAIWTSTLERTVQSVEGLSPDDYEIKHMRNLNEISAGQCENLTYDEIESQYPQVWAERQANKLLFRYPGPGGESYSDVIERLRPVIVELERMESDTLIVSHQVVMRTLLAYFCGLPLEEMTHLGLQPTPYGADLIKYEWNPITDEFDVVGTTL
ncbi:6-phosphofructo-2-kinase-domain-containing protein [Chytridium lagenaria]|nr:6-phosphofructo-2-kinase-domain-containing protein [Chytridium lagenaria]